MSIDDELMDKLVKEHEIYLTKVQNEMWKYFISTCEKYKHDKDTVIASLTGSFINYYMDHTAILIADLPVDNEVCLDILKDTISGIQKGVISRLKKNCDEMKILDAFDCLRKYMDEKNAT